MFTCNQENEIRQFIMEAPGRAWRLRTINYLQKNGGNFKICFVLYENINLLLAVEMSPADNY